MAINRVVFTVFPLWMSTYIMIARRTDSGWISPNQTVTESDNVTLTCLSHPSLYPADWYFYFSNGTRVVVYAHSRIQYKKETYNVVYGSGYYNLSIYNISLSNGGKYECIENSGVGSYPPLNSYLNVTDIDECRESPCDINATCANTVTGYNCSCNVGFAGLGQNGTCHEIRTLQHENLHKLVGDEGLLTCDTNDNAFVIWLFLSSAESVQDFLYYNGGVPPDAGQKVSAVYKRGQCGKCGSYDIKLRSMQLGYAGWYVCIENEGYGKAHGTFLKVTGLEGLDYVPEFTFVGSNKTLRCQTDPKKRVVWFYAGNFTSPRKYLFKNGSVESNAGRGVGLSIKQSSGQYDIYFHHAQFNDSGYYVCIDDDGIGVIRRSYELKVKDVAKCSMEEIDSCGANSECTKTVEGFTCVCDINFVRSGDRCVEANSFHTALIIVWTFIGVVVVVVMVTVLVCWKMRHRLKDWWRKVVEEVEKPLLTDAERDFLRGRSTCVIPAGADGEVRGMTMHDDKLLLVRYPTVNQFEVYDVSNPGKPRGLKTIRIEGLSDKAYVYGLTSCKDNCVYVSCWSLTENQPNRGGDITNTGDNAFIYGVGFAMDNKKKKKKNIIGYAMQYDVLNGYKPYDLSVNAQRNLLVTCQTDTGSGRLLEFDESVKLVREIILPNSVSYPRHTVQLEENQFLVSHGSAVSAINRVCIIEIFTTSRSLVGYSRGSGQPPTNETQSPADADDQRTDKEQEQSQFLDMRGSNESAEDRVSMYETGPTRSSVIYWFGRQRGSAKNQLNKPGYVAVKDGLIIVADELNNRIVVLKKGSRSPKLLFVGEFGGIDVLNGPRSLCLIPENGLYAGETSGLKRVLSIWDKPQGYNARIEKLRRLLSLRLSAREVAHLMFERGGVHALSISQLDAVLVQSNDPTKAADTLLDILLQLRNNEITDRFLSALQETDQNDVYECITKPADTSSAQGYWLDIRHIRVLEHCTVLLHNMEYGARLEEKLIAKSNERSALIRTLELAELTASRNPKEKLLSLLARKSLDQFKVFLKALEDTGQGDLAKKLLEALETEKVNEYPELESDDEESGLIMERHFDEMVNIEPSVREADLPDFLKRLHQRYAEMVEQLSARPVAVELSKCGDLLLLDKIKEVYLAETRELAAKRLLNLLLVSRDKNSYDRFLVALKATDQEHLFLWLKHDDYINDRQHAGIIRQNYSSLVQSLNVRDSGLLDKLLSMVNDQKEKESIKIVGSDVGQAEILLSVILRQSVRQFDQFLVALAQTGHEQIASNLRHQLCVASSVRYVATGDDCKGEVAGLTVHGDEVFVVRSPSPGRIEAYNASDFTPRRGHIEVEQLKVGRKFIVRGMTSCEFNNCLYVSKWDGGVKRRGSIVRVELTDDNKASEWALVGLFKDENGDEQSETKEVEGDPVGLSVNSEHNLIVVCVGSPRKLIEYTTEGVFVRQVILEVDLNWPWHAIQLNDGQYLVSHGRDRSLHRVCVVDAKGRVLRSYGKDAGSGFGQLNVPKHTAVREDGLIYVADMINNRIVVLDTMDSSLTLSHYILVGRFEKPYSFYFGKKPKQLIVCERYGSGSRIAVVANV